MTDLASETVLEETLGRALTFLRGIAKFPHIHALLAQNGYTPENHTEGWQLLLAAAGAPAAATAKPTPVATPAQQAMLTLDAWDEQGFMRIDAALEGAFPDQHAFVFAGGLAPSVGPAAVLGVQTLLERLDALESGKGRPKASHKKDEGALTLLAARGFTKEERQRLAGLVKQATTIEAPKAPVETKREEALHALYLWYRDWAKTARAVIKKRAYLISLGLAKRKSSGKNAAAAPPPAEPPAGEPKPS